MQCWNWSGPGLHLQPIPYPSNRTRRLTSDQCGEKYDPANYRPVSLICICWKTLEHILVSKIMQHLSEYDILVVSQHGFRSGRPCETQLVQFIHDLRENLDGAHNRGHKQTDLIIMDFAKALDKMQHWRLSYKLEYYGIPNDILQWITTWLSGRTQKVVWYPPVLHIRAHSLFDIYKWPSWQHKFHSPPFWGWLCPLSNN